MHTRNTTGFHRKLKTVIMVFLTMILLPWTNAFSLQEIMSKKDGDWQNPSTWQGGTVPGPNDNVKINRNVTISSDVSCADLRVLSHGSISGTGTTPITLTVNGAFDFNGTFNHNDIVNVYLRGTGYNQSLSCSSFFGLTLDGSYLVEQNTVISGMLYVKPGASLTDYAAYTIDVTSPDTAFRNEGTVTLNSTVRYSGTADQYVTGASYGSLVVTGTGTTKTALGDIIVQDTLHIATGTVFVAGSSVITLNGSGTPFSDNGTFLYGTSTVKYDGYSNQSIAATSYYHLEASNGVKDLSGSAMVYGDFTFASQINAGADTIHIQGSHIVSGWGYISGGLLSVRFFGTGNSRFVPSQMAMPDAHHLIIQKNTIADTVRVEPATSGYSAAVKSDADGNMDIYSGVFDLSTAFIQRVTGWTQTGRFLLNDGAVFRVAHADGMPYFAYWGGTGPIDYSTYTIGNNSIWELYGGDQTVRGASEAIASYGHLVLMGTGTKTQESDVTIAGSLTRTTPTFYSIGTSSLTYLPGTTLYYVLSDSTDMAFQVAQTTANDEFPSANGPANVSISNNLNVTLHANRTISGELRLLDGKMILGSANLIIDMNGTILYATSDRYIVTDGPGFLVKNNLGTTPFAFPIGPSIDAYDPVTLTNTGAIDSYYARVQSWITYSPFDATRIVNRQWTLDEAVAGGSVLSASFQWDHTEQAAQFNPYGTVLLLRSVSGSWGEMHPTSISGTGSYIADVSGITSLSDFILANDGFLPVELTTFSGTAQDHAVHLEWHTASELNNAGFTVYRRTGSGDWTQLAFIPGQGTVSEPQQYRYVDQLDDLRIVPDVCYYKLRQQDNNGVWTESEEIAVQTGSASSFDVVSVYPQPCVSTSYVEMELKEEDVLQVELYDASGMLRRTLLQRERLPEGRHTIRLERGMLPSGVYFIRIMGKYESRMVKCIFAR